MSGVWRGPSVVDVLVWWQPAASGSFSPTEELLSKDTDGRGGAAGQKLAPRPAIADTATATSGLLKGSTGFFTPRGGIWVEADPRHACPWRAPALKKGAVSCVHCPTMLCGGHNDA
jgi:hypothetical protein